MLEHYLKSAVTRQRLRSGPAADHIDGFADWLHRHSYRPITIDTTLRSLASWTDWMRAAGFTAQDFLADREGPERARRPRRHPHDHAAYQWRVQRFRRPPSPARQAEKGAGGGGRLAGRGRTRQRERRR